MCVEEQKTRRVRGRALRSSGCVEQATFNRERSGLIVVDELMVHSRLLRSIGMGTHLQKCVLHRLFRDASLKTFHYRVQRSNESSTSSIVM